MEVKKILWPTDLSGRAKNALDYVRFLTEKFNAEIHVLYVITDFAHHRGLYGNFTPDHVDKIFEWEKNKAKQRLDELCSKELEGCPLYVKHVAVGDPAQEIIKCIFEKTIDMVVLATCGAGGIFEFGAVAEKVVRHSSAPVVIIPTKEKVIELGR